MKLSYLLCATLLISPLATVDSAAASRWENTIAGFEKGDRENPPPENAILFIGSSSIRGWRTLADDFPNQTVINRGFGGSKISDSIEFADRIVIPYKPSMVLLYAGDNDIKGGMTPDEVVEDFKKFVAVVHEKLPETPVAFISIKPSPSRASLLEAMREANRKISEFASATPNVEYIDIFTPMLDEEGNPRPELFVKDMLHLNADGYELWTKIVRPHLKKAK